MTTSHLQDSLFDPTPPVKEGASSTEIIDSLAQSPDTREAIQALGFVDRLRALAESPNAGFIPVNRGEVTEALTLVAFMNGPFELNPTADHLAEIMTHQQKAKTRRLSKAALARVDGDVTGVMKHTAVGEKTDPRKTLMSVVREYTEYATDAYRDVNALKRLAETLDDIDHLPPSRVLGDVTTELGANDGVVQLIRYLDAREAIARGDETFAGYDIFTSTCKDHARGRGNLYVLADHRLEVRQHMGDVLATVSALDVRISILPAALNEQRRRRDFWRDRISEAEANTLAAKEIRRLREISAPK